MKKLILITYCILCILKIKAQSLYFPPLSGKVWDSNSVEQLGWCSDKVDSLYSFLQQKNTRAFLVLIDGKIVLEKYFGTFTQDSLWYWASAGKTLTAMLVGIAQKQNLLNINDTSSKFLGIGWTSETADKERLITIKHQLTMTTGLDDGVSNNDCTDKSCLQFKTDAGGRWAYHNAPYTMLDQVITNASGQSFNQYFNANIRNKIGMTGFWYKPDYNNVYYSNPRSMARYGLLLLNKGIWNGNAVLDDSVYFNQMTNTSQNFNLSYGYLTWLNGKTSFMSPGIQIVFPGAMCPDAPADMFAAEGKYGQIINVVPSMNLVMVRMGDSPSDLGAVPITFNNDIWVNLNKVICKRRASLAQITSLNNIEIYPNPVNDLLQVKGLETMKDLKLSLMDLKGSVLMNTKQSTININEFASGYYLLCVETEAGRCYRKIVKN